MKVLITSNSFGRYDKDPVEMMQNAGWDLIPNPFGRILSEDEMVELIKDVDAVILGSDPVTRKVLENANKLKVISRYGVGTDNIDLETAKRLGITVKIAKDANSEAVADYTIGLMLSTLRHISDTDQHLRNGTWKKYTGLDLCNKTVGVFGLGAIGKGVVKRLSGFGCTILGYDLYEDAEFNSKYNVTLSDAQTIFEKADIISLHIPGNANNQPLIGEDELNILKDTAVIINTARASLVDEKAVVDAINAGKIYGYGTDVFSSEPNIPEIFVGQKNVVLSPHMAAVSVGAINKMSQMAVQNIFDNL